MECCLFSLICFRRKANSDFTSWFTAEAHFCLLINYSVCAVQITIQFGENEKTVGLNNTTPSIWKYIQRVTANAMRYFCWSSVDQAVKTSFHERNLSLICPNDLQMIYKWSCRQWKKIRQAHRMRLSFNWNVTGFIQEPAFISEITWFLLNKLPGPNAIPWPFIIRLYFN